MGSRRGLCGHFTQRVSKMVRGIHEGLGHVRGGRAIQKLIAQLTDLKQRQTPMITISILLLWLAVTARMLFCYIAGQQISRHAVLTTKADNLFPVWAVLLLLTIVSAKLFQF